MYTHILHATDLNDTHFHVCEQAVQIAKKFDATLYILHVIEPPTSLQLAQSLGFAEFDSPVKEDAELVLATLGDAFAIPSTRLFVEVGSIKTHTIQKINELNCNLLIIGNHHANRLPWLLDSSAKDLSETVACDVLTIRTV